MEGNLYIYIYIFAFFTAMFLFFYFFINYRNKKSIIKKSLNYKLFLIKIPRPNNTKDNNSNFKDDINLTEQLFSLFSSFKDVVILESVIHNIGNSICFYISIPSKYVESTKRDIEGIFNGAIIEESPEYNIFNAEGSTSGIYITQKKHYSLPIRTYIEINSDSFSPILNNISKMNEVGEGAAIQVLIKPASKSYKDKIFSIIKGLKKGESFSNLVKSGNIEEIKKAINTKKQDNNNKERNIDENIIKLIESKVTKPIFNVNYRIVVSTLNKIKTDELLDGISTSFSQFSSPERNDFKINKIKNIQNFAYNFSFRLFDNKQSMLLNSQELASIFHIPSLSTIVHNIKWLESKEAPPPEDIPKSGTLIGKSVYRGEEKNIYITDNDRRRHVYIIGQTGTGKSTLMINMINDDILKGKGVAVIDPHGDLAENILGLIPNNRIDDVIVFNPSDLKRPVIGLNMLEYNFDRPEEKTFIVNELIEIFDKLYDMKTTGGPMFEMYMRNAVLLLLEDAKSDPSTLMEIQRVFTDEDYRKEKLKRITNPVVIDFWTKEANKVGGEASLANITPYITSKFNNFTANDYMRPIIGQVKSSFKFRDIMDNKKILIIKLSKGKIGDLNAKLLGMILIGKILISALSRVDLPENERVDFNLYIDEFQNFTTNSISVILSEARKYRLNLTIAHQFIGQLSEDIKKSVFGNIGSSIVFRVGMDDAEFLEKQFNPVFSMYDLANIANYNAYVKLLINNKLTRPFNIRTIPSPDPDLLLAQKIEEISAKKYGKNINIVEREILERLRK